MVSNFLLGFGGGIATAAIDNKKAQREADARNAEIVMQQQMKMASTIATKAYERDAEAQTASEVSRIIREAGGNYSSPEVQSKIAAVPGGIKALRNLAETNKFTAESASLGAINDSRRAIFGGGSTPSAAPSSPTASVPPVADPLMPNFQDTVADVGFVEPPSSGGLVTPPTSAPGMTPEMQAIQDNINKAAAVGDNDSVKVLEKQMEEATAAGIRSGILPSPDAQKEKAKSDRQRDELLTKQALEIPQLSQIADNMIAAINSSPEYQGFLGETKLLGDQVATGMGLPNLVSTGDVASGQSLVSMFKSSALAAQSSNFKGSSSDRDISTMFATSANPKNVPEANLSLAYAVKHDAKLKQDILLLQKEWFKKYKTYDGVDRAIGNYVKSHPFIKPGNIFDGEKAVTDKKYGDSFADKINTSYLMSDKSNVDDFLHYKDGDESIPAKTGNTVPLDWVLGIRKQPTNQQLKEKFIQKFGEDAYSKIQ